MKPTIPKVHNLLRLSILLRLNQTPAHGYQLILDVGRQLNQKVSASHVYPFLRELEKKKWIRSKRKGRATVFDLTPKGRTQVAVLLTHFGGLLQAALGARIKTCAHCGCKVFEGGHDYRGRTYCCHFCAQAMERRP